MDSGFNLGHIFGIRFRVHYSWFFIFLLITVFLAQQVFPVAVPRENTSTYWIMGAVTSLLFFFSVLFHETSHSLVGRANGIPVSSITLFLFGGAAQMTREPASAGAEMKMALAGPMSSLGLAAAFWMIYSFYLGIENTVAAMALWLAQINLIVAVFNLLPGFPLDGGRVFRGLWWHFRRDYEGATRVAVFAGRITGFLIIGAGLYFIVYYRDWLAGVWLAVLGWYLESAARTSLKQFELQIWLKGKKVSEVVNKECPVVAENTTVAQLRQEHPGRRCFWVEAEGTISGAVFLPGKGDDLELKIISDLAQPIAGAIEVGPDTDLLVLVQEFNETGKDVALVTGYEERGLVFLDELVELVNRQRNQGVGNTGTGGK
ncbi:site-2 protease family protein [Dehalogenimonas sp. THU2]|uniref:site-2 protease family protein n=1 Tax=Dehalogenimonas sp. THU2 TaxID=3151121 RepID=UPI0032189504